eukprot:TRINITY_DN146_c0_g2_i4.p2 TRINITY_DN146_c0_g2~~TRINITY_DN146_c0_g2_i4.p2  ORF type:complete len:222 (+),score=47.95 TRINITY_DN146_c0_g2_i4:501-1166(+)
MRKPAKCNKKCQKFGKADCPAGRCKVDGDDCADVESAGLPKLPTEPGCYIHAPKKCGKRPVMNDAWYSDNHRGSATNEAVCKARAAEFDRWCPTTGAISEFVPASGGSDPTEEECNEVTSPQGCRDFGCDYNENNGSCNRKCGKFAFGACPRRCKRNPTTKKCLPPPAAPGGSEDDCDKRNEDEENCKAFGCDFMKETKKCRKKCANYATPGNCPKGADAS